MNADQRMHVSGNAPHPLLAGPFRPDKEMPWVVLNADGLVVGDVQSDNAAELCALLNAGWEAKQRQDPRWMPWCQCDHGGLDHGRIAAILGSKATCMKCGKPPKPPEQEMSDFCQQPQHEPKSRLLED